MKGPGGNCWEYQGGAAGCRGSSQVSQKMAGDIASMAYDLGVLVEGQHYLRTREMGPVEGKTEVLAEPSKEEEEEEDMTLKE